jgi:ArsR family transcriptional regulator
MPDSVEVARLLDILGNRNRRRIIDLLRQKPCFVTEISETLMLSPKAVIEHLQMMEREAILACQTDDRRRKYYYLANDILVEVSLRESVSLPSADFPPADDSQNDLFVSSVAMLSRMIKAHDKLTDSIEQLNHDIETKITDLARNHKDILHDEHDLSVIIALCHDSLTAEEIGHVIGRSVEGLTPLLRRLERRGIVVRRQGRYQLRGVHAEQG